jgi:hypothetical protein
VPSCLPSDSHILPEAAILHEGHSVISGHGTQVDL